MSDRSLRDFLLEIAASQAEGDEAVRVRAAGDVHEVVARGGVVAVLEPGALQALLRPGVAAAAARTPDVTVSPRGPGWVRFEPAILDAFARDRAAAWLESAIRLALDGDGPGVAR